MFLVLVQGEKCVCGFEIPYPLSGTGLISHMTLTRIRLTAVRTTVKASRLHNYARDLIMRSKYWVPQDDCFVSPRIKY